MRYLVGFLVTIGLIVLVLYLLLSGGSSTPATKQINLGDYANNANVRAQLIVDGPIVADANHQQMEIDVTSTEVSMTIYQGYQRTIVTTKSYPNNQNAFNSFLYGLQRSNFSKGNADKALTDNRGYCVAGNRYNYTFNDGDKTVFHYWKSSCGQGTFKGNTDTTMFLFRSQVPDYGAITQQLNIAV